MVSKISNNVVSNVRRQDHVECKENQSVVYFTDINDDLPAKNCTIFGWLIIPKETMQNTHLYHDQYKALYDICVEIKNEIDKVNNERVLTFRDKETGIIFNMPTLPRSDSGRSLIKVWNNTTPRSLSILNHEVEFERLNLKKAYIAHVIVINLFELENFLIKYRNSGLNIPVSIQFFREICGNLFHSETLLLHGQNLYCLVSTGDELVDIAVDNGYRLYYPVFYPYNILIDGVLIPCLHQRAINCCSIMADRMSLILNRAARDSGIGQNLQLLIVSKKELMSVDEMFSATGLNHDKYNVSMNEIDELSGYVVVPPRISSMFQTTLSRQINHLYYRLESERRSSILDTYLYRIDDKSSEFLIGEKYLDKLARGKIFTNSRKVQDYGSDVA